MRPGHDPPPQIAWPDTARRAAFEDWLSGVAPRHGIDVSRISPASADASFRRYLRLGCLEGQHSFIVMDAPPGQEDVRPFMQVAELVRAAGLPAAQVLEADATRGFLLLNDLGRQTLLDKLRHADLAQAQPLMREAAALLVRWQAGVRADSLPRVDAAFLQNELALFPQWCVRRKFGIEWNETEQASWKRLTLLLVGNLMAQPMLAMHADWMPRNLMVSDAGLAIIDFQDAMCGPLAHDLASLLRDAFISWPEEQELDWAVRYWQAARAAGLAVPEDFGSFWQTVEWTGLYRHLRVLGIFCRLEQRDGKAQYAADLPRFFAYCTKVALRYAPLSPLLPLLEPMSGLDLASGYTF